MMTSALWHLFSALVSIVAGTSFSPNASFTNIAFETIEPAAGIRTRRDRRDKRSEEHTSELQSLMRISYAVFCLKKKTNHSINQQHIKPKKRPDTIIKHT